MLTNMPITVLNSASKISAIRVRAVREAKHGRILILTIVKGCQLDRVRQL